MTTLRRIPETMRQRLMTTAMGAVAAEQGTDRLTVEDRYSRGRTAIVHLHHNDYFAVRGHQHQAVGDGIKQLLGLTDQLLAAAAVGVVPQATINRIRAAADQLQPALAKGRAQHNLITPEDVETLIAIVEKATQLHVDAGYDPAGILDPSILKLAKMVAANFPAYELTLTTG